MTPPPLIISFGLMTSFVVAIVDLSHMAYLVFFGSKLGATQWCCTEERGAPVRHVAAGTIMVPVLIEYGPCGRKRR